MEGESLRIGDIIFNPHGTGLARVESIELDSGYIISRRIGTSRGLPRRSSQTGRTREEYCRKVINAVEDLQRMYNATV